MKKPLQLKKLSIIFLLFVLLSFTITAIFLIAPYSNKNKTTNEPLGFAGSYQTSEDGESMPLTDSTFVDACKNDTLILRGHFDRALQKGTQLLFYLEYLEVHIYAGDTELFSYGTPDTYPAMMQSAGAAWSHLILPEALTPQSEITITLQSKYKNNYSTAYHDFLNSMVTGDSGALARTVFNKNWVNIVASLLLFYLGLALLLFTFILQKQSVSIHPSVYCCGAFIVSSSVWIAINPSYSTLVIPNSVLIMLIESVFIWLSDMLLCAYLGTFLNGKPRKINDCVLLVLMSSAVVFLLLQFFGAGDAYALRGVQLAVFAAGVAVSVFAFVCELHATNEPALRELILPGIAILAFSGIEVLNYSFEWIKTGSAALVGFLIFIITQFIAAVRHIRQSVRLAEETANLKIELQKSRTAIMLSQIQPHFLYNSLLGIKELCDTEPKMASEALEHFSYYLRSNLDSLSDRRMIPFEKELDHIRDYLYLEQMRFAEKLTVRWELDFTDFLLPPLTVQPLVENAVRHGIIKKSGGGTLTIRSECTEDAVIISIDDTGIGFDVEAPLEDTRSHIGIENVRSRLKTDCGGSLVIQSQKGAGTQVKIMLPYTKQLGGKEE